MKYFLDWLLIMQWQKTLNIYCYLIATTYHGIWREQTRTERLLKNAKYVDKLKFWVLTELIVKMWFLEGEREINK